MQAFLCLFFLLSFIYLAQSVILKTTMTNNYPQIAVLGCDSNKANLYYDIQRQVWVEHLISRCMNDEESILKFCQQAYPSLDIGNIVRLESVLRFENWCKLLPSTDDSVPRCSTESLTEEITQPFRCLQKNSKREELVVPNFDCTMNSIKDTGECLRAEKWLQYASVDCSNKGMILNSSTMTVDWCGLEQFRGVEFICCPVKDIDFLNDYQTSVDEKNDNAVDEDNSINELIIVPKTSTTETPRKIIAMSLGSGEPSWMEDYRGWNTDLGYFADDEDTTDDQDEMKLKSSRKSHLTINEHDRFSQDKKRFQKKYKEQIDQLKSRWQKRHNEIQLLANQNPNQAQKEYENTEIQFRREYDTLKQIASQERARINELHEKNLDNLLDIAKNDTNQKLIDAWNEKPLKAENVEDALYNYLHALLRDRIHLVNRYERLRAVDPDQANRKRVSIHERLRSIANRINNALNQLRRYSKLQSKIQPRIDTLLAEYDEVNQAADQLLTDYLALISTTSKNRLLPLGRDEKKIYPFAATQLNNVDDNNNNGEYQYDTNGEYDDGDDDDDSTTTRNEVNNNNNEQVDAGRSNWDLDIDSDVTLNVEIDSDDTRPLMPMNNKNARRIPRNLFITYLPYVIGILFVLCITFGILIFRFIIQERKKYRYNGNYDKNYVFSEVDTYTAEEKALHALQMNGYENPTYKFFEGQTPKC